MSPVAAFMIARMMACPADGLGVLLLGGARSDVTCQKKG